MPKTISRKNENKSYLAFFSAPPSPPGRPVVIDISETRCTLRWEPSEDDGGADIKHYIVEYFRDVWEVWLKAKTTKETQVSYSIKNKLFFSILQKKYSM